MAAVTVQVKEAEPPMAGLRPMDPLRDLASVVDLIELGFWSELDPQGRRMLRQMRRVAERGHLARLVYGGASGACGFVWVEDARLVGNLSLRRAYPAWRKGMLIGNVVVHPDYRGRGIARALMEAALSAARERDAHWVGLEVRADNEVARGLYEHLGFAAVGETVHLVRPEGLPWLASPRLTRTHRWRKATPKDKLSWAMLAEALHPPLQAEVLEVRPNLYNFGGWERSFDLFLRGERAWSWLSEGETGEALDMAVRVHAYGRDRFTTWDLLVRPRLGVEGAREAVARALAAGNPLLRKRPVVTMVEQGSALIPILTGLGFHRHRILVQMRKGM